MVLQSTTLVLTPFCFVWEIKLLPLPFALFPRTLLPCWVLLVLGVVHHCSRCLKCSSRISPPFLARCPPTSCRVLQDFLCVCTWLWARFLHTLFLQSHLNTLPNTHAGLHPWYLYCVFELFIAPRLIVVVSWGDVPLKGCSDAMRSFLPFKNYL